MFGTSYCYLWHLTGKGSKRELDIELHKMGDINLPASQGSTASHPRGLQHCSLPSGLTFLPHPFWYQFAQWDQGKAGTSTIEVKMVQGEVLD